MSVIEHYSYKDYIHWEGDWELINGEALAMAPSPIINHQAIATMIIFELVSVVKDCPNCLVLYEEDWKIDESTILKPDVVLICDEPSKKHITKAPKIIVEVISKSTARRDEKFKFEIYEKERVEYYILVYPNDCKAKIYKLRDDKYFKEGDFSKETYLFEETKCRAKIDFNEVFKKFRDCEEEV